MVPQIPRKSEQTALWERRSERAQIGPQIAFASALVLGFATWSASRTLLSSDAVMPVVSTLFLVLAGICGLIAWRRGRMDPGNVSYTDVAGALTLIGLCVAATIDPEQMIRLADASRE
jgi:hypothetical protein